MRTLTAAKRRTLTRKGAFPAQLPVPTAHRQELMESAHAWHIRLNHASPGSIRVMASLPYISGIDLRLQHGRPPMTCGGCAAGHSQKAPHANRTPHTAPGHTIAADIAGPMPTTAEGFTHLLVITELHSRFRIGYLLKRRSDATEALLNGVTATARHFRHPPARIRVAMPMSCSPKPCILTLASTEW